MKPSVPKLIRPRLDADGSLEHLEVLQVNYLARSCLCGQRCAVYVAKLCLIWSDGWSQLLPDLDASLSLPWIPCTLLLSAASPRGEANFPAFLQLESAI